jgi:maltose alpha-D-glucosyltransferase/alpha-amylase
MINIRKQHHAFGRGSMEWVMTGNPTLAVYARKYLDDILLIIHNLTGSEQTASFSPEYRGDYLDLIAEKERHIAADLRLQPYAHLWLKQNYKTLH